MSAVDLCAGPGGWDTAASELGIDVEGIEWDHPACETRRAAGLRTIEADISQLDPHVFADVDGVIASPPCPAFSSAGKGEGREHLPALIAAVHARDWAARPSADPKVWLGLEVGRWVDAIQPDWIALEQVPAVLPLWEAYAHIWRQDGYSVWTGLLCAADYGVPQTRTRAILIASRARPALPPTPTHAEHPGDALFDQRLPWVTMAEALGWGTDGVLIGGPQANATVRRLDEPAPTILAAADNGGFRWQYRLDRRQVGAPVLDCAKVPAPTVVGAALGKGVWKAWTYERQATTVQCDPRLGEPGHRDREGGERQFQPDAIRLTVRDALILQGFPADYPVQGTKTKQFEQVGNAIPPPLAKAVLAAVAGGAA